MESLIDIKKLPFSSSSAFKNRMDDPLVGSFFVSFILYNWEIFLYIFSSTDVAIKIEKINNILFPSMPNIVSITSVFTVLIYLIKHPFVAPIFFSLAVLIVIPRYCRPIYKWILDQRVKLDNDKYEAEQLLTPNDLKIKKIQESLNAEILQSHDLRSSNDSKDEVIRLLKIQNADLIEEYSKIQEENISKTTTKEEVSNFTEALMPSPELAAVVGNEPLPRTLVVSKMWSYIKEHNLQNPKNRRNIIADEKLFKIFGKREATMFELAGIVSKHLSKINS